MVPKTPFEKRLFQRFEEHARLEQERREEIKNLPSSFSKGQLEIEVEYLRNSLQEILKYIDDGGTDINKVFAEAFVGLYGSRL